MGRTSEAKPGHSSRRSLSWLHVEVTALYLDQLGSQGKLGAFAILVHESLEVCIKVLKDLFQQKLPQRSHFIVCNMRDDENKLGAWLHMSHQV